MQELISIQSLISVILVLNLIGIFLVMTNHQTHRKTVRTFMQDEAEWAMATTRLLDELTDRVDFLEQARRLEATERKKKTNVKKKAADSKPSDGNDRPDVPLDIAT